MFKTSRFSFVYNTKKLMAIQMSIEPSKLCYQAQHHDSKSNLQIIVTKYRENSRRAWQLAPVFLPGEFHGQRSLGGYSPWGCRVGPD